MAKRPNILLITCDQWRGDSLSAAGHKVVRTPNADALAREGVLFRRHYAGAAPCSPARACLYTGLYQMNNRVCRNGSPLDMRHGNIALAARSLGYDPTLFGYTDVSPDPRTLAPDDPFLTTYEGVLPGFTVRQYLPEHQKQWRSWLASRGVPVTKAWQDMHRPVSGPADPPADDVPVYAADETPTTFLTNEFLRWLSERDEDAGWFAHISYLSPHPPFIVPAPFNTMYDAADGPAFHRAASPEEEGDLHPFLAWQIARQEKADFRPGATGPVSDWSEDDFRRLRATYRGMISEVDSQLGRLWDGLRHADAWDDTIIVLTSDHAEIMGDHYLLGKGGFHEGSYHIPLIVRDPRLADAAGTTVDRFTEAVDIFPTLLDLIGGAPRPHLDGRSLRPFLRGQKPSGWREAAHWEFDFRSVDTQAAERHFGVSSRQLNLAVLRGERFKYVHFGGGLPPLLFDLDEDPGELRDLAADPAHAGIRIAMAEQMLSWRGEHLDQALALARLTDEGVYGSYAERPFRP